VIRPLPESIREVLGAGAFCHLAVRGADERPHLTPVVHALSGDRLWVTTARTSVKARAWRRDPGVGGLVKAGGLAVSFVGTVEAFDLLDARTWGPSIRSSPAVTLAAARFTTRNARFFAGYAVDARHVPLAWTPPGRVFAAISIEAAALLDLETGSVVRGWSMEPSGSVAGRSSYRAGSDRWDPVGAVPPRVAERLGRSGDAVLAVEAEGGPLVVPARWAAPAGTEARVRELLAVASVEHLSLVPPGEPVAPVALTIDRASTWRARAMTGLQVRGDSTAFAFDGLRSGRAAATEAAREAGEDDLEGRVLLRIRPRSAVWWSGWSSGTVRPS
jgi:hypothetical protein